MRQIKEKYIIAFLEVFIFCLTTAGSASAIAITVDDSGGSGADFTSIQAAINAAHAGDKIIVKPGTYVESINVDKNLNIVSESGNPSNTIVKAGKDSEDIFSVWSNGVSINGLSIKGARNAGIHLFGVSNCKIANNKFSKNGCGIDLYAFSSGNTIDNNKILDSETGISLGDSLNNTLSNNSISNCSSAISLFDSVNNTLKDNSISSNVEGISLTGESDGNIITKNAVKLNEENGLHDYGTSDNLIYNNYFNNSENIEFDSESFSDANIWNTTKTAGTNIVGGSYIGGNFWAKPDNSMYPDGAWDTNHDGIFDKQYNIEGSSFTDFLPLKESKPLIITVGGSKDKDANFSSIQAAINNASTGDVVLVHPGIYKENINVNVTNLTLTSESGKSGNTSIQPANNSSDVVNVVADGVTISGLNISGNLSSSCAGIHLNGVNNCRIERNQLSGNSSGSVPDAFSRNSSSTSTVNNSSSNTGFGIRLDFSASNSLSNNTLSDDGVPICLHNSTRNLLANNTASNSSCGIWIKSSSNNTLNGNNVSDNKVGICLEVSSGNKLDNSKVLNNTVSGINLCNSSENVINNSLISSNNVSIVLQNSSKNLLNKNLVSNSAYGVWVHSLSNKNELADNIVINNEVGIHLNDSVENILTGNTVLNCSGSGINLQNSTGNILSNNTALNNASILLKNSSKNIFANNLVASNNYGFWVSSSDKNKFIDNKASNNKFGIYLKDSSGNILSGNTVNLNTLYGVYLDFSAGNVLIGNRIMNSEYGLYLLDSRFSSINNNYLSNTNNAYFGGPARGTGLNMIKAVLETNILRSFYLSGNFWATPTWKGFTNQE